MENTGCKDFHIAFIDFVVKRCFITRLRLDRQEQLFHSLRRFSSCVLAPVTFISDDIQETF